MRAIITFITTTGRVATYLYKLDAELLGGTLPPLRPGQLQKRIKELLDDPQAVRKRRADARAAEDAYDRAHRRVPRIAFRSPDSSPLPLDEYEEADLAFQYELDAPRPRAASGGSDLGSTPDQSPAPKPAPAALQDTLQTADAAVALFITISAPPGVRLDRATWLQVFVTVLHELGLPFRALPWIVSRHNDTSKDHIHGLVLLRTFDGRRVKVRTGDVTSERLHRLLCDRLGLPAPEYFDPKTPRLVSVTPKRKVRHDLHKQELLRDLNASMQTCAPTSLDELDQAMALQPGRFVRRLATNTGGTLSSRWSRPGWVGCFGGNLGKAYEPRHLDGRFRLAASLRTLSAKLELLRAVQSLVAHGAALPPDAPRLGGCPMPSAPTLPSPPVIPGPLPERPNGAPTQAPGASQEILIEIRDMLARLMPLVDIPAAPEGQGMLARLYTLLLQTAEELDRSRLERGMVETELRTGQAALEQLTAEMASSREDLARLRAEVASLKDQAATTGRMIGEMHAIFTASLPPSEDG
jgi:hypothetical protein